MVIRRGEIWWANLREPIGAEPGYRRPVLVISIDDMNSSAIDTVIIAVLTSNQRHAQAPGNVLLPSAKTGLPKDSVVNVSQLMTVDKSFLSECIGELDEATMTDVADGLRIVMGL